MHASSQLLCDIRLTDQTLYTGAARILQHELLSDVNKNWIWAAWWCSTQIASQHARRLRNSFQMMMMHSPGITELSLGVAHLQAQLHHNSTRLLHKHVWRGRIWVKQSHLPKTASRNDPRGHSSPKFIEFNEYQFQNSAVFSQVFTNGSHHTHLCGTYKKKKRERERPSTQEKPA